MDFSLIDYLNYWRQAEYQLLQEALNQLTDREDIDRAYQMYEQRLREIQGMIETVNKGWMPAENLPNYNEYRNQYLTSQGKERTEFEAGLQIIVPNKVAIDGATGRYYDPDSGQELTLENAIKEINDYFATETVELTPYQQQEINLANQRLQLEQQGMEADEAYRQAQLVLQRQQLGFEQQQYQAELAESQRKYLAELQASPGPWIKAWAYENPPLTQEQEIMYQYPWARYEQGREWAQGQIDYLNVTREQLLRGENLWQYDDLINAAGDIPGAVEQVESEIDRLEAMESQLTNEYAKQKQIWLQNYGTEYPMSPLPANTPPAPQGMDWVSQLVPGWEVGQPIPENATARLASAQLWNQIPWSQREMFGGYLSSQYQQGIPSLRDYEEMIAMRLPQRVSQAGWRSAFQV